MYYVTCKVCTRWSFQYESCVFFSYKNSGSSSSKCNNVCTRDCMRTCLFQFSFDLINHLKTSEGIFIRPAIFFTSNRHTIVQQNRRIATLSLKISLCYIKKLWCCDSDCGQRPIFKTRIGIMFVISLPGRSNRGSEVEGEKRRVLYL